ncbi:MAG: T9SS type A sorting domain-containing protein [Chitinophagaceae bacterium]|nr:T9SS type A sorting domain-containing protein [Chitinophagaceae bacterium]
MKKQVLFVLMCCAFFATQATALNDLWMISGEKVISVPGERKIIPMEYALAKLDVQSFKLQQLTIPDEASGLSSLISLPTPDGGVMNFRIFEVPMMEPALAAKYPQIKTYTAVNVENTGITAKIDFTVFGFHAMIMNGEQTYFIDPYSNLNDEWYVVYYKHHYAKGLNDRMHCGAEDEHELIAVDRQIELSGQTITPNSYKTNGTNKRTYRLALACTMEYSTAVGGATPTKASVLSAMVTSMNRVNGVFEKDFSMHANLVANNDTLIFLPGGTDPYTNNNGGTMLGQNQTTVNARIGSANYDYGHVFSTGGGGIASLGCVCNNNSKAQGVTGSSNPVGDPYDIDYVAHEMGHQFGGSHTFNSVTGSCNGNRSSSSAFEIGSATTIQGYAGICGSDDIQPHSDDYYHIRSLEQMTGTSVMACAASVSAGNTVPTLNPIANTYIIPYRTPFELTASGTDADGDSLFYCWEEYDRGGSGGAWNAPTTVAPILRSFFPNPSPTRVFPARIKLIQNLEYYLGERLPDTARVLKFRCTLRDIHNGYGAFTTSTDTLKLDVRSTNPELFRVTSQATPTPWQGNSQQTITWNVAGTATAPVAATNVDIFFSPDSAKTWTAVATGVPNSGTATITVPNVNATWGRVKVKGAGNVFFDLNDGWITVTQVSWPAGIRDIDAASVNVYPNPNQGSFTVEFAEILSDASYEVINNIGAIVASGDLKNKQLITLDQAAKGIYFLKIKTAHQGQLVKKIVVQ